MNKTNDASVSEALNVVERDPARGPLFWWLYDNHADMLRRAAGQRINWTELCPRLTKLGLTDQAGKPMTTQTARKTWARVCQMKVRTQETRDRQRSARGRQSERGKDADRPPPVLAAPAPRPPVPSYPPPVLPPPKPLLQPAIASRPHEELSEEEREAYAKAQILRLRRRFAEASGHDPDEIK